MARLNWRVISGFTSVPLTPSVWAVVLICTSDCSGPSDPPPCGWSGCARGWGSKIDQSRSALTLRIAFLADFDSHDCISVGRIRRGRSSTESASTLRPLCIPFRPVAGCCPISEVGSTRGPSVRPESQCGELGAPRRWQHPGRGARFLRVSRTLDSRRVPVVERTSLRRIALHHMISFSAQPSVAERSSRTGVMR
jgi:hypothetical protein